MNESAPRTRPRMDTVRLFLLVTLALCIGWILRGPQTGASVPPTLLTPSAHASFIEVGRFEPGAPYQILTTNQTGESVHCWTFKNQPGSAPTLIRTRTYRIKPGGAYDAFGK